MNVNKILITSLISMSFLFTGFKADTYDSSLLSLYNDYTYEQVLKEERVDSSSNTYTYFEYNFTNTGEGYLYQVTVTSFGWLKAEKKSLGDILRYSHPFLLPHSSAIYSFEVYDYNDEEITFEGRGYRTIDIANNLNYSNFNIEYKGTPGNSDGVYTYAYLSEMNISYDKDTNYDYTEYFFVNYKGILYPIIGVNGSTWIYSKEELDEEQLSASAVVFKRKRMPMDPCYPHPEFSKNMKILLIVLGITLIGLPLVGALVPIVILIVNKSKKAKEKES